MRCEKARQRTQKVSSRRKYSLKYFLFIGERKIRVCKEFYLGTLDISQRRISYFHECMKDRNTGIPSSGERRGKNTKRKIPEDDKDLVREHIRSFPKIESHYCRSKTKKEYLESSLTLQKMYRMYKSMCEEKNKAPVKLSMYRFVFNTEFNIEFQKPKKDRCDLCEENKMRKANNQGICSDFQEKYEKHMASKLATKEERAKDRSGQDTVISIDLQNVIALPRANISSFFYKRKLNVYNLTAHCSKSKKGHCCIWSEATSGRAGNDLASATVEILEHVVKMNPDITKVILWSDSCVPQNRNSSMTLALLAFLSKHQKITSLEQKYCEPGHSSIQEVDNLHSQIEKALSVSEVYSPLGLVRLLLAVKEHNPLNVIQLQKAKVMNYKAAASNIVFRDIPYSKVKHIIYNQSNLQEVLYRTDFSKPFTKISLRQKPTTRGMGEEESGPYELPKISALKRNVDLSKEKIKDIKSMFKYMPNADREYMHTVCK